ncbi:hypothetical protein AXF42_Ash010448 [Apostasia shenzhenica]|uniref:Translation initiation factor eIF2B subunit delta n=1 Tax=Apostasia shenzhenica TaxID=1088818 RepID=A0A2I0BE17_9ASPA|nr:hypothetical protein AXF42_Ash010448 [Apostasia shenzhenica]
MDSRRLQRAVIDPKVRQVGFFTSGDPPGGRSHSITADAGAPATGISSSPPPSDLSSHGSSLSPVMIPPPRHSSMAAAPVPVPGHMSALRRDVMQMPIGSYNPVGESFLGVSPMLSPSSGRINGSEFSEEASTPGWLRRTGSGKAAASFPVSSGEIMMAMKSSGNAPAMSELTTASVMQTLPGITEKDGETSIDLKREGGGTTGPQKQKTTKGERRAIQEAERAAKAAAREAAKTRKPTTTSGDGALATSKQEKGVKQLSQRKDGPQDSTTFLEKRTDRIPDKDRKKDVPQPRMQFDDKSRVEKAKKRAIVNQFEAKNRVELFRHLPQYEYGPQLPYLEAKFFHLDHIHPSVYKVGLRYLSGASTGGNSRCTEMLLAFRDAVIDYSTPPEKTLVRDLTSKISSYVSFLIECRPLSVGMGNAIRFLKSRIVKLNQNLSESESKSSLISDIDRFINEKIKVADKVIVQHAVTKIRDGDVLLIYGYSTVVEMMLLQAHELGRQFRVVVIDSRPKLEGQKLLRTLVTVGISCTYTHINAISYIMHEVTRTFLGASAILSNGTVYSRVGTATIAMVAHAFRVPVLICCEAYKFHERVQLDSICSNELGDPDVISKLPGRKHFSYLENWSDYKNLQLLNLLYDATPPDYVSMIVTEHGMVRCI